MTGVPQQLLADFIPSSGVNSGQTMFLRLRQGQYFAVVPHVVAHVAQRSVFPITVQGTRTGRRLPTSTAVFRPSGTGSSWSASPRTMKKSGVLTLDNTSNSVHEIVLAPMRPGATLTLLKAALNSGARLSPYLSPAHRVHLGAIGPKRKDSVRYRIPGGQYAVIDFWPNGSGVSNSDLGMVRVITVR